MLYANYLNLYVAKRISRKRVKPSVFCLLIWMTAWGRTSHPYRFGNGSLLFFYQRLFAGDPGDRQSACRRLLVRTLEAESRYSKASGKTDEALKQYAELLSLVEQTNVTAFTRQLNQLRMLHDLNDKKMQEQKLLYQKRQPPRNRCSLRPLLSCPAYCWFCCMSCSAIPIVPAN